MIMMSDSSSSRFYSLLRILLIATCVMVFMGLWINFLKFPWVWLRYITLGVEFLFVSVLIGMELQAQNLNISPLLTYTHFSLWSFSFASGLGILRFCLWLYASD